MYTKSMRYALTGVLLPALFAATPVEAQVQFASQNTVSFLAGNSHSRSLPAYYTQSKQDRFAGNSSLFFLMLGGIGNNNIVEETPTTGGNSPTSGLAITKTENKFVAFSGKIKFKPTTFSYPVGPGKEIGLPGYSSQQLLPYVVVLKEYAKKYGYDTTYAFFSNMGMLPSVKRFFVVDLVKMEIISTGLVAQGRGQGSSRFDRQYSNEQESRCTSLGRYSIRRKYKGEYGFAYRMTGLDSTNSNACKRNIVLHSMGCMPDDEENVPVCISEGCPAVSVKFLSALSKILDTRKKPVLLWIFDSNLEEPVVEDDEFGSYPANEEEKTGHRCAIHSAADGLY